MQQPQRISLVDQVVTALRQGISEGRWTGEMPSERALCRELQVSRLIVRTALGQIRRQRLIARGTRGRPHRIRQVTATATPLRGRVVRILTPYSWRCEGSALAAMVEEFSERLGRAGYRVEIEYRPGVYARSRPGELRRLDSLPDTAGWLVLYATEAIQRWFVTSGRPCVVTGRTYEGVRLSSVSIDVEVLARHAAGMLVQRRHRNLVYLIAEFTSLSDRLSSAAFVEEARRLDANARVITHPADAPSLRQTLDVTLATSPRPTGIYSSCPEHCLTALCHLHHTGVRVPHDMAIICGSNHFFLNYSVPTIAHYRYDDPKVGRKAATMLLDQFRQGPGKLSTVRILPEFVPGGSLANEGSIETIP